MTDKASTPHDAHNHRQSATRAKSRLRYLWFLAIPAAIAAWFWLRPTSIDLDPLLDRGRLLLAQRDYPRARQIAQDVLKVDDDSSAGLFIAAQAELGLSNHDVALEYLLRIPDDDSPDSISAALLASQIYLRERKQPTPAERMLLRVLAHEPTRREALEAIVYMWGFESRAWEAIPWKLRLLMESAERTPAETLQLYSLTLGDTALENPEIIVELEQTSPDDPGVQIAAARLNFEYRRYEQALELSRQAARSLKPSGEALARWGMSIVELADEKLFREWNAALTDEALLHPGVWFARGLWASNHNQRQAAARCLWETIKRNPEHQKANYQLGLILTSLDRIEEADIFLRRSQSLEDYMRMSELAHQVALPASCLSAAQQAERLGLLREAYCWGQAALAREPRLKPAQELVARLKPRLNDLPLMRGHPAENPANRVDLSSYPVLAEPSGSEGTLAENAGHGTSSSAANSITFNDVSLKAGLDFTYLNAGDPHNKGLRNMYEIVGGGAGVLDYDGDGIPDLWLGQADETFPSAPDQSQHLDRVFRLDADGRYRDVTEQAMVFENGFSQGVTTGDVNVDGFVDVFITNIGRNRLFINNGDGTFTESETNYASGDQYSVCGAIVDLNGDGWPEIYEVNYLSGDDLFTKICGDATGYIGSCLPHLFDPAPDQLYLNLGDGRFENISKASGIQNVDGKGLGIVAWRSDVDRLPSLFIANDVGPNFLFVNQANRGETPLFAEHGLLSGLALNRNGKTESSMGIAAGDYNGDGMCDFFISNFDNETNTLYTQNGDMLFSDATMDSRLGDKRFLYVGWGTQFLDADLDGWLDLMLTNGHVNQLKGKPFQMPTQFFRNRGNGTFEELSAARLGPYFSRNVLGRGLARLDWNRDGREDALITHLDAPVALLENDSRNIGRYFSLELRGIESPRDPVGTIVKLQIGERTLVRQLTAGDGNQVSNQRLLIFGLGQGEDDETIEQVVIHWPSGHIDAHQRIPCNSAWIAVEGLTELTRANGNPRRK